MTKLVFSDQYLANLSRIEDYFFMLAQSEEPVARFLNVHDRALSFIQENPLASPVSSLTGLRSRPFGGGRYRIFYHLPANSTSEIWMVDLIDNMQANIHIYPGNSIETYFEDED